MKIRKGKQYILFGNFPNPQETQKQFKELLGVEVVAILNNADTTVAMEYVKKEPFIKRLFRLFQE